MLCTLSHRLPGAAAISARRGAASPLPAATFLPTRALLTRAQKENQPQPEPSSSQPQQSEGGSQLQSRTTQTGELSPMAPGADLMMDMRAMMPMPFRRMTDHMLQMQREMDSLMGAFGMPSMLGAAADPFDIFDRVAAAPLMARRGGAPLLGGRVVPLDVTADDKGYTVTAEVPGFDKSDIKVSLTEDGMLTMTGSHEETSALGGGGGEEKEASATAGTSRRYASFVRSIQLPDDADTGGISATTQHGVLSVRIPKTEKPAPRIREIPVA